MSMRVVVVGSINVDEAFRMQRLPAPGETVTVDSFAQSLGGKGANQAVAAARAGAAVEMIGAVGGDGRDVIGLLAADQIDIDGVTEVSGTPTGRAVVLVDEDAENSIVVVPGANRLIPLSAVRDACRRFRPDDVLVLQHEIPIEVARAAVQSVAGVGTVIWNAAPAPRSRAEILDGIDVLVVNEHELAAIRDLLGLIAAEDLVMSLHQVGEHLDADVVCTLGAAGAAYWIDGRFGRAPSRRVEAVDTTAAGDTFVGYLAAATGSSFEERMRVALDAASLTVTRPGASTSIPTMREVTATRTPDTTERNPR